VKKATQELQKFLSKKNLIGDLDGKLVISFAIVLLLSMIFGSIYANYINLNIIKKLDILFLSDFDNRNNQGIIYTFISSFSSNFLFWLEMAFLSTSLFGIILTPLILIFRGVGLGLTAGYLYLIYSFKGVVFYILVLLPGIFISSVCFIFMLINSEKFSIKVTKQFISKSPQQPLREDMIIYIKKSSFILFALAISSICDMIFMKLFSCLFTF
jgi:Integral membrane protein DUF95.